MSNSKWNRDVFKTLIKSIPDNTNRIKLIDAMLKDATETQRISLMQWVDELLNEQQLYHLVHTSTRQNLWHILLYYQHYSENLLPQTIKVIMGKLSMSKKLSRNDLIQLLGDYEKEQLYDVVEFILKQYDFSDWVGSILLDTRNIFLTLQNHAKDKWKEDANRFLVESVDNIVRMLYHSDNVFKNPGKRIKR